jgi:hypothetical protein
MTRRGFHILLALVLVACVLSPYVELSLNWGQSVFDTGYDTETTVAVIALLLILTFALAVLLAHFIADTTDQERHIDSPVVLPAAVDFISTVPEFSPPPLSLRI